MAQTHSPLRYPGGKSCLLPLVSAILEGNNLRLHHYAEPYAGGASLALGLLFQDLVSDIHLNDIDAGIWSFWYSILNETDTFIHLIDATEVTVDEWRKQREFYRAKELDDPVKLGFATFFLNRTNRSGIIGSGGVIGGLAQEGSYKIDCRFNKDELIRRIRRIRKYKSRIHLTRLDALQFLKHGSGLFPKRTFLAIDPPYFAKGSSLYTSFYSPSDHADVARAILALEHPWILTYDAAAEISALYAEQPRFLFDIKYSLQTKRTGSELLIASHNLLLPQSFSNVKVDQAMFSAAA
jgi:DNA adenine methylase